MTVEIKANVKMRKEFISSLLKDLIDESVVLKEELPVLEQWATMFFDEMHMEGEYNVNVSHFEDCLYSFIGGLRTAKSGKIIVV